MGIFMADCRNFFMLLIIPIYCHLFTPVWILSVCLSVYFRYMNCAPNKCAFTKRWVTNHLPWLVFMVTWRLSKASILAHLQHCVAAFRCSAGPLMLLAMALSSSHLNNAAKQWVKRPPTRSVPFMRFFGGCGHTVKALWIAVLRWVMAVQLGQRVLSSLSAK